MTPQLWFSRLPPRERALIATALVLAVFAVFMMGLVRPLASSRSALADQLVEKRAILADLERVAARFGQPGGAALAATSSGNESLVVLVDRTSRSSGLNVYLRRNEPEGENGIRLRFENVPFDELVSWIGEIQGTHTLTVSSASADPGDGPGRIDASLQLTRSARQ